MIVFSEVGGNRLGHDAPKQGADKSGTMNKNLLAPESVSDKYEKAALKGAHEWKNFPYASGWHPGRPCTWSRYDCYLCGWQEYFDRQTDENVISAAFNDHLRSPLHKTRYQQFEEAQKSYITERRNNFIEQSQHLRERINQLGLLKWRTHVGSLLTQYIETPLPDYKKELFKSSEANRRLAKVQAELALYERMESLSIVELAFIKVQRGVDVIIFDKQNACNDELRLVTFVTCGTSDIMPVVAHFLGKPPRIDDLEHWRVPRM